VERHFRFPEIRRSMKGRNRRVSTCPRDDNSLLQGGLNAKIMETIGAESKMTSLSPADAERLKRAFLRCREMGGTLNEQLRAYADAGREIFPAYGEAVDRLVERLNQNGGGESAPRPGEVMPPFMLPDDQGRLITLRSLLARGPLAVMFFRGHWCPYCRLNVRAVILAQDRIRAMGAQIVAIMPETQEYTGRFKADSSAPFPVLTDLDNGYALSLNLAIWLGSEIQQLLSYQDMAKFHGNNGWMLPIPAVFVVGRDGVIKARFVDPDFRRRMEIDDLLEALEQASEER
jgi:peroxiredoxin